MATTYLTKTVRLMEYEFACLKAAVAALGERDPAYTLAPLMATGALEEAHRLGFWTAVRPTTRMRSGAWKNAPHRPPEEGSTREKVTFTVHPAHSLLIAEAAKYTDTSEPLFYLGSCFRYLSNLKLQNEQFRTSTDPELRKQYSEAFANVRLPKQYEPFPERFDASDPDWV